MSELITWLRQQLDDDERWARAASQRYPYATGGDLPPGGVHWTWVAGENWELVTPDPVIEEFVAEPGYSCNLATVETWPTQYGHDMPRTYANSIVEMDASAAGHIARWDPARVLAEVEAKRRILDLHEPIHGLDVKGVATCRTCHAVPPCQHVRLLAQPYDARDGWREEWRAL
jgi:hypothetical protein